MRNKLFLLVLLAVFLFISGCFHENKLTPEERAYLEKKETITFVSQNRYPPFEYVNNYGQITGMSIELARWMGIEYNFQPRFLHTTFANAKEMVLSGEADVITTFFYSRKRDKKYEFTDMIFRVPASIFVKDNNTTIQGSEDLNGATLAIQRGDYALDFLASKNINYNILYTDNFEEAANKVLTGKADATVADEQIVIHYLKDNNLLNEIKIVGDPLYVGKDCMAVAEGNDILVSVLSKAVRRAKDTGVLKKIEHKWMGTKLTPAYVKYIPYLILFLLILVGLVITVWYWNISLKKQVYLKTMDLRKREKNLLDILRAARDVAIIKAELVNDLWKIVIFNKGASRLFEYESSEIVGKSILKLFPEAEKESIQDLINQIISGNSEIKHDGIKGEMDFRKKGGQNFPALFTINPVYDNKGVVNSIILVATDITKRKKAEKAIAESAERMNALINASPDFICFKDEKGRWLIANEAALELFSLKNVDYYKKTDAELAELVGDCYKEAFINCLKTDEEAWKSGNVYRSEERIVSPDGTENVFDMFKVPIFNENGERKNLVILGRDITELKRYEKEILEEREYLSVTLRSIGDAVISTDVNGKIVVINRVAEELTGYSRNEAADRDIDSVFNIVDRKTGRRLESPYQRVLQSGKNITLENDILLISKNGDQYIISDSGAPIFDNEKNIIGVVIVFRDITENEMMQQELLKMEKLKSVGVLAGGIAHDFNNILTAISSNISLVRIINDEKKAEKIYEKVDNSIERAKKLTNQLLTFSKGGSPVKKITQIKDIIKDTVDFTLAGSNVKVVYQFEPDTPPLYVDSNQVSQVFQNLAVNARDAMENGGKLMIQVEKADITDDKKLNPGEYLRIKFIDEGKGISPETQQKIFDPFFTTKTGGSGLGLATSYSIITKHGGTIELDSKEGLGATFTVDLPVNRDIGDMTDIYDDTIVRDKYEIKERDVFKNKRIFMLDDEAPILESSRIYLEMIGFEVTTAASEDEVYEKFQKNIFDIAILDLTIPGSRSGEQILQDIKEIDEKVKTVVTSGYSENDVMKNYKDYGFDECILKPFDFSKLENILQSLLNG
ncbi:PAS domain S-box protein [Flexistipes sp.]|uniref:PAS domain S-box protein n=1 Tax=Flexistipes sp. TaxID=3088135 RepID=UPI002E1CDC51|nr:PAS domain S-box protein [Flexistipes sp.]